MQASPGVVFAALTPHPPVVVPEVGGRQQRRVQASAAAMHDLAGRLLKAGPRSLIVISPHGPMSRAGFAAQSAPVLEGDLGEFGAPQVRLKLSTDLELLAAVEQRTKADGIPLALTGLPGRGQAVERLHYATLVPLHFLRQGGFDGEVLVLTTGFVDLETCYRCGKSLAAAAAALGRPVGVIASGDLSHRLQPGAPAGYDPRGREFDELVMAALGQGRYDRLLEIDEDLAEAAGECGLRPIVTMLGALSTNAALQPEVLSYEGPFGVGYGVVAFSARPAAGDTHAVSGSQACAGGPHPLVALARATIESYVSHRRVPAPPSGPLPPGLPAIAGAFVSLHRHGRLRGCIGTIEPSRPSLAEEVITNAIGAATDDPRFDPVGPEELADLEVSVDVLSRAEPVQGLTELDPQRYGVIVQKGRRRGLLLPDLEGVETAAEQVDIAARKAGLRPDDPRLRLLRFEVTRLR